MLGTAVIWVRRVSTRDDLKLMDVGAGKAAMSKVVPEFPPTVRYGVLQCVPPA